MIDHNLLVLPQRGVDGHGDVIRLDLAAVEQLLEEATLARFLLQQVRVQTHRLHGARLKHAE